MLKTKLLLLSLLCGSLTVAQASSTKSSSSSHHTSTDSDISSCCKKILSELDEIEEHLEEQFPCDAPIAISSVPILINTSGKYCVTEDLVYSGTAAAIHVTADNVSINFANHSLTLVQTSATGILAENLQEFTVENDAIFTPTVSTNQNGGAAISLIGVDKARIDNIFTENTTYGILISNSTDILVTRSRLKNHNFGAALEASGSINVAIVDSTFSGSDQQNFGAPHIAFLDGCQDCRIYNSEFSDVDFGILLQEVNGVLIDKITATAASWAVYNFLQVGNFISAPSSPAAQKVQSNGDVIYDAYNIIITNSTFTARPTECALSGFDGLIFLSGSGATVDNVIVDVNSEKDDCYIPAAIRVGCGSNGDCSCNIEFDNLVVRNSTIQNVIEVGIYFEVAENGVVDNSLITDARCQNVLFDNSKNSTIKNSTIQDGGGNGIEVTSNGCGNAILNNIVSGNDGTGILIDDCAQKTHVRGNSVFDNDGDGINNQGKDTETYFNTSCNNGGTDCINVFPDQSAGDPAVAGSNICCTSGGE